MTKKKPDPALHPALADERRKMLEQRKQKLLEPRRTYAAHPRVEFEGVSPMHRAPIDPRRDLPQASARPGAMDAFRLPSRGFA